MAEVGNGNAQGAKGAQGAQGAQGAKTGELTRAELFDVCGRTVVIMLALDGPDAPSLRDHQGDPAMSWVAATAFRCQVTDVFALASPAISHQASYAAQRRLGRREGTTVQVAEVDQAALSDRDRLAGGYALMGLPFSLLEIAWAVAGPVAGGYDNVIFVSASDVNLDLRHIYELSLEAERHSGADAIGAQFGELRTLPILLSHAFLDRVGRLSTALGEYGADVDAAVRDLADYSPVVRYHRFS